MTDEIKERLAYLFATLYADVRDRSPAAKRVIENTTTAITDIHTSGEDRLMSIRTLAEVMFGGDSDD